MNTTVHLTPLHLQQGQTSTERRLSRLESLLAERQGTLPVWIRCPKSGYEYYSGFTRAKLYDCASKRLIRSVSVCDPGLTRGTRLFHLQSILDYIAKVEVETPIQPKRALAAQPA